jgi:hypothetical protein
MKVTTPNGHTARRRSMPEKTSAPNKRPRVKEKEGVNADTLESFVVCGSVVVPGVPIPHRLVMAEHRQAFDAGVLAREAMSIPPHASLKKMLVSTRKHIKDEESKSSTCVVSVSIRKCDQTLPWCPPPNETALVGGLLGSFVDMGTRWFLNKSDATKYTLLCAALVGNKGFTSNVLVPRYFANASAEDLVVLYQPLRVKNAGKQGLLFAALTLVGKKQVAFHLADDVGKTCCPDGGFPTGL